MPNFNIVIDSGKFTPFSFAEKIAPLEMYREQYEKDEERYLQLAEKMGDLLLAVANSKGVVKNIYDTYNNELTQAATAFANGPMTADTRRLLSNLRKDYGLKIRGIEKALESLLKEAELRRKEISQDPSKVYRNSNLNIDDFYEGKQLDQHSLSGNVMYAETAEMASKYALAVYSNPEWSKIAGNPYYLQVAIQNGAEAAMLDYVRSGSWKNIPHGENASLQERELYNNIKGFADIYNSLMAKTAGYSDVDKASIEEKVYLGLYAGLAKPKYDFLRDLGVLTKSESTTAAHLGNADLRARQLWNVSYKYTDKDNNTYTIYPNRGYATTSDPNDATKTINVKIPEGAITSTTTTRGATKSEKVYQNTYKGTTYDYRGNRPYSSKAATEEASKRAFDAAYRGDEGYTLEELDISDQRIPETIRRAAEEKNSSKVKVVTHNNETYYSWDEYKLEEAKLVNVDDWEDTDPIIVK